MEKENTCFFTQSQEEDTESLLNRARRLINGDVDRKLLREITPNKPADAYLKNSNVKNKPESVKDARRLIRKEWDALINCTLPDDEVPSRSEDQVLYGVVAYVEIQNERRIDLLTSVLRGLGASVRNKFVQEVTHIVFKNGSMATFKRAKLLNVHLVSVLWVEACKNSKAKISEKLFPVYEKNDYSNSPRRFRKFMKNQRGHFEYDDTTGTISRRLHNKPQLPDCQDVVNSRIETKTNCNNRNSSSSSAESITLHLSADKSPPPNLQIENDDPLDNNYKHTVSNSSEAKSAHLTRRQLFVKNPIRGSFLTLHADSSCNSQSEKTKAILPNPYSELNTKRKSIHRNEIVINTVNHEKSCNRRLFPTTHVTLKKSPTKNMNKHKSKLPSLVTTYLHSVENKSVKEIIRKLGCFNLKSTVDATTTHVIVGDCNRTMNLLKGIARGCWILNKRWIFESASVGHWLAEEYYELTDFSKIVRRCRIQRQALGKDFTLDIFDECGIIHISGDSVSYHDDLKELVILCGGKLTPTVEGASIIVGSVDNISKECVSPDWILDSIAFGRCKTISKYYLKTS